MFSELCEQVVGFKYSVSIFCLIEFPDVEHFQLGFVGDLGLLP